MKRFIYFTAALVLLALFSMTAFGAEKNVLTVKDLNTEHEKASHVSDDFNTSSVELNYREIVDLNSPKTSYKRYDNAFYPRIKQLRDDLYILFFMGGQTGPHLYYTLSKDGVTWDNPEPFHATNDDKKFVHTDGPLAGKNDSMIGCNADAIILDNGDILCIYYERPSIAYAENYAPYWDMNGIFMVRGKLDENDKVVWGEHTKIYTGTGWEPYIHKLADGTLQIFWSSNAEYHSLYGYDIVRRSTYVMMIESTDNGYTWSPVVKEGDKNNYVALRVFKESIGKKIPDVKNKTYTEPIQYWTGQMPVVTTLYNGRSLMAVESKQANITFDISLGISEEGGKWRSLNFEEEGPDTIIHSICDGAGPYLNTFPSGEVYLTYHNGRDFFYRMLSPDGTAWGKERSALPGTGGMWGSSLIVGPHEVISAFQAKYGDKYGIQLGHSYLNHRTNAKKMTPAIDGAFAEWKSNTDALFVGSKAQAQITQQVAHDENNVYFLVNRLDNYLRSGDAVIVNIGVGDTQYYRVTVELDGSMSVLYIDRGVETKVSGGTAAVKTYGTVDNNNDTDEGAVIEISIPKSLVNLTNATSFKASPAVVNQDGAGAICDTLDNIPAFVTTSWPEVVLD
ncbi:MAG: hypothetical protein E7598_00920 [Ruminococcaceae bacterium]|nr:hypothetical protein [Oscillospiraceae bacterium]